MNNYNVTLRDGHQQKIQAENVHVTPQGNVKLLNGKGDSAVLVAFFNAYDVISVIKGE